MKRTFISAVIGSVIIAACSSSQITGSWKAEDVQSKAYKKILVLALINEPDRTIREKMEEHIAGDLRELGYTAICSCDEYSPKSFENMKEQEALAKLANGGIDAVLTIVLLNKTKERYYVPNTAYYSQYSTYHNQFWGYYASTYDRIYSPGYYTVDTKYFWESNFYSMDKASQLLYSAQSQSFDPASASSLGHEYGQMIIKDMVKNKVLSDQKAVKKAF